MIIPDASDAYGQLLAVLMLMALIAYLAPGMMTLSPQGARYFQLAAIGLLGAAIVIAVVATVIWFAA